MKRKVIDTGKPLIPQNTSLIALYPPVVQTGKYYIHQETKHSTVHRISQNLQGNLPCR